MSSSSSTFVGLLMSLMVGIAVSSQPLASAASNSSRPLASAALGPVHVGIGGDSEHAFMKAFTVVSFAEIFDKTWFVTLILALKSGKRYAFLSSFAALAVHTVMAAALGVEIARWFLPSTIDFLTAALFAMFTVLYAKDLYHADPEADMLKSGMEDGGDCFKSEEEEGLIGKTNNDIANTGATNARPTTMGKPDKESQWSRKFGGFMLVFIAEWGDRTQFAMIGLHSSLPVVPVFFGSLIAFAMLSFSAVCVADIVANQSIRERHVFGAVSLSFSVFALMALRDGFASRAAGK